MTASRKTCKALRLHEADNVAIALAELTKGADVLVSGEEVVILKEDVPFGHKLAIRPLNKGDIAVKHGVQIGVSTQDIPAGTHVHVHNLRSLQWEEQ